MRLREQISSLSIQQETSDSPHLELRTWHWLYVNYSDSSLIVAGLGVMEITAGEKELQEKGYGL